MSGNARRHWVLTSLALSKGYFVLEAKVVVLGRGRECQVPVFHDSVSRRHAQVTREGPAFTLADLGSANGTFLNGRPIKGPEPLAHDDVIGIGKVPFRFLVVEGSREELLSRFDPRTEETERTVSGLAASALFAGTFTGMQLATLARMIEQSRHSGVLRVEAAGRSGILRFREGVVVEASFPGGSGEEAARTILSLEQGDYAFYAAAPGAAAPRGSLTLSVAALAPPGS